MKAINPGNTHGLQVGPVTIPQKNSGLRINWHAVGILAYHYYKKFNAVCIPGGLIAKIRPSMFDSSGKYGMVDISLLSSGTIYAHYNCITLGEANRIAANDNAILIRNEF